MTGIVIGFLCGCNVFDLIASRIPPGPNRRVANNVWAVCRPLFISRLRPSGGSLGAFRWEASGALPRSSQGCQSAREAPKNRETRSQDTARTRRRGPRWPPGGPEEDPTHPKRPQTVPRGFENDIQEKKEKTSKSTTLSTKKLDL